MARRTIEQTRRVLLDAGLRCLQQRGVSIGLMHIKLSDVASEAGLTTGAAYKCWENQESFHYDLGVAAMGWRKRQSIATSVEAIRGLVDHQAPWQEVIRVGCQAYLDSCISDPSFVTSIALRSSAGCHSALTDAARDRLTSAVTAFADLYAAMFAVYRRRLRDPYTMDEFALTIAALAEGYVLQVLSGVDHPRVSRAQRIAGVGADWSLFAVAMEAIVESFTEPIAPTTVSTS